MKNKGVDLFCYLYGLISAINCIPAYIIFFTSLSVLAQPYRLDSTTLGSTSSDKRRLDYETTNPREALAQIQFHQFLSRNPKALYMMDQYETARNKKSMEDARRRIQRNDFFQNILPVVKADISVQGRFSKKFNLSKVPILKKLGVSASVDGGISVSKTWTSEELVRNYYARQYVQDVTGNIENKIDAYSRNLTHDIYECEKQPNSCRLNTDPAFQYLYEVVFKKDFPDFPVFERRKEEGQRVYFSFDELKVKFSEEALLVQNAFTSDGVLRSQKELKTLIVDQIRQENKLASERVDQLQKSRISKALFDSDVTGQHPYIQQMENEINFLEKSIKDIQDQHQKGHYTEKEFQDKVKELETGIAQKELNIRVHNFRSSINKSQQWVGAAVAFAQMVNAPKEVVQLGQAASAGMDIIKGLGPIFMGATFDPTGITLAIAGITSIMSIFSDTPSAETVILNELSEIKANQVKMLNLLYEIDFQIEGLKNELKKLEMIIKTNHQEVMRSIEDIDMRLVNISDDINALYEIEKINTNLIATIRTQDANISNMTEDYGQHRTLTKKYEECYTYYDYHIQSAKSDNLQLSELHECLDSCISKRSQLGDFRSCHDSCQPFAGELCDAKCMSHLVDRKMHNRQMYNSCRRDVDEDLIKKESDVSGIYAEFTNYSSFPFVLSVEDEEEYDDYRYAISRPSEERINIMPQISPAMQNKMSLIVQNNDQDQINQQLWNESYLGQYRALLNLGVNQPHLLSNPKNVDESFSVYVDTIGRLPLPGTPIGPDGEIYSYPINYLENMCVQAQYVENISRVSRKNIQNAFILYKYEVDQLNKKLRQTFVGHLEYLRKGYISFTQKQESQKHSERSAYSESECNCEKDYSSTKTSIFNIIDPKTYSIALFLGSAQDQWGILEDKIQLSDDELINHGFYRVDRSHGECQKYKRTGRPMNEAKVNRPLPLQAFTRYLGRGSGGRARWLLVY